MKDYGGEAAHQHIGPGASQYCEFNAKGDRRASDLGGDSVDCSKPAQQNDTRHEGAVRGSEAILIRYPGETSS